MVMGDIYMLMSYAEFKHLLEVGWWVALMEDLVNKGADIRDE